MTTEESSPEPSSLMILGKVFWTFAAGIGFLGLAVIAVIAVFVTGAVVLVGFGMTLLMVVFELFDPGTGATMWNNMPQYGRAWLIISTVLGFALVIIPSGDPHV